MLNGWWWNSRVCHAFWILSATVSSVAIAQLHLRTQPKPPAAETATVGDTLSRPPSMSSPRLELSRPDSGKDTLHALPLAEESEQKTGGIDTIVVFAAQDTMLFTAADRRVYLRGNAQLSLRQQHLEADAIELWIERAELHAFSSEQGSRGNARFRDGAQLYRGESLRYNFQTRRGVVTGVSTHLGEGFYYGERLKQVEPGTFYVQTGCYTTCDADPPHFVICSPRMKILAGDQIFARPLVVYVADVPIMAFPFGLFFPNRGGRQSGFLTPSFFFSPTGGIVLENLGYFYAPSQYWDAQLRLTLRTRQGAVMHTLLRYALRDRLQGSMELSGGWVQPDLDAPGRGQWNVVWNHRQRITPQWDIQANVRLGSPDYYRQVSTDLRQRLVDNIVSTLATSYLFESGASLSVALQREQSVSTGAHSGIFPQLALTLPSWTPLREWYAIPGWLRQLTANYTVTALWRYTRAADRTYAHQSYISHTPSLRLAPRLGYITVTPNVSYSERWYFRQLERGVQDSVVYSRTAAGFFREYWYSFGLSLSTRLYGLALLHGIGGLEAFRHLFQPILTLSYTPAFPQFYGSYVDPRSGARIRYSRFALDGGGLAPQNAILRLDYRLLNSFEVKPLLQDTAPVPPIEFFRLAVAGSYNALADSLRLSDLSFDFSIPALRTMSLQGSATATPYMELPPGGPLSSWRRVNRLRLAEGLFPLRWTSIRIQAEMAFGGQLHLGKADSAHDTAARTPQVLDGSGERSTPPAPQLLQWNLRLGTAFRYEEPLPKQLSRSADLVLGFGFRLGGWQIQASGSLDLLQGQLVAPVVSIYRDLHCWELRLEWYPLGTFRGYWLRFSPKASVLRDLKYEEKTIPGL